MDDDYEEKEMYLYLDFNGRITQETFDNKDLFFKVVNLDQKHPLVQIGGTIFQGTYDDCIGTNIFLEESEEPVHRDPVFEKETAISLKYVTKQFKVLKMQWAKIPEEVMQLEETELYDLKFTEDYETVLEKLEKQTLNFEDIIDKVEPENDKSDDENVTAEENTRTVIETVENIEPVITENMEASTSTSKTPVIFKTLSKHETLELIAREPLKRIKQEETFEIPPELKLNYKYHDLRRRLLNGTQFFPFITLEYDKKTLRGAVDVNRCIRQSLIDTSTEIPRVLTQDEKKSLLTFENSENLSIPMRYCVVRKMMKTLKRFIKQNGEGCSEEMTDFELSVKDTYKLLKAVANDLKAYILQNKEDVQETTEEAEGEQFSSEEEWEREVEIMDEIDEKEAGEDTEKISEDVGME